MTCASDYALLAIVFFGRPTEINHNVETVERVRMFLDVANEHAGDIDKTCFIGQALLERKLRLLP